MESFPSDFSQDSRTEIRPSELTDLLNLHDMSFTSHNSQGATPGLTAERTFPMIPSEGNTTIAQSLNLTLSSAAGSLMARAWDNCCQNSVALPGVNSNGEIHSSKEDVSPTINMKNKPKR